jgi:ABC-type glycerol-3-phosphate transport system substrate-binding protein
MFRRMKFVLLGLLVSVSAACGSSTTAGTDSPTPTSPSPSVSAKPVSYDPCVLVTAQEASTLTGVNYGAGMEQADTEKRCVYGYQTTDVLMVGIVQAPDLATVQAQEAEARAALQQQAGQGLNFTELQGVGDSAAVIQSSKSVNGTTLAVCGIYVVRGTIFFFIADVAANHAVPNNAALQSQAIVVLGRL